MALNPEKRIRITVEGEAGSGKNVMANAIKRYLQSHGVYAVINPSPDMTRREIVFADENFEEKDLEQVHHERFVDIEVLQTKRNLNPHVVTCRKTLEAVAEQIAYEGFMAGHQAPGLYPGESWEEFWENRGPSFLQFVKDAQALANQQAREAREEPEDEEDDCCCGQQRNPSHCACGKKPEPIVYAKRRAPASHHPFRR
jgi:ABC-type dipeptide/oligopeptide/nickel transport system ATPase component